MLTAVTSVSIFELSFWQTLLVDSLTINKHLQTFKWQMCSTVAGSRFNLRSVKVFMQYHTYAALRSSRVYRLKYYSATVSYGSSKWTPLSIKDSLKRFLLQKSYAGVQTSMPWLTQRIKHETIYGQMTFPEGWACSLFADIWLITCKF